MKSMLFKTILAWLILSFCSPFNVSAQSYCNPTSSITPGNPFIARRTFQGQIILGLGPDFNSSRYVDYTSQVSKTAKRGESVSLRIGLNNCGSQTPFRIRIWVDWNADGDFTDPGENVSSVSATIPTGNCWFQTYDNDFNVPLTGIADGNKRVRVAVARGNSFPSPCGGFTGEAEDYNLTILPNSAPVLNSSGTPVFNSLTTSQTNTSGQTIESLLISTRPLSNENSYITDPDEPQLPHGLAIFQTNAPNGTWQYQLNGSNSWNNFPSVSTSGALGLFGDDRIRFVPSGTGTASISFRAWDATFGTRGNTFNIGATGGSSAFSTATDQAQIIVSNSTTAQVFLADFADDQLLSSSIIPSSGDIAQFNLVATDATSLANTYEIAHNSTQLFWTNGEGRIQSRLISGGSIQTLVSNLGSTFGIDVSDNHLFYSDYTPSSTTGKVYKADLNGSNPTVLDNNLGLVWSLGYDDATNRVYYIDQAGANRTIKWVSANGGGSTVFHTGSGNIRGLEVFNGDIYWIEYLPNNFLTVFKKPTGGGSATVVTTVSNQPLSGFDIEIDQQNSQLYVLLQNFLIASVPLSGGTLTNANTFGQEGVGRAFLIVNPDAPICGAPQITCPSDINVNIAPGQCQQVVSYTAPAGSSGCPNPVTARTAGLASGSAFPVGINTVTYQVTDVNNATADCSFTITVTDNENPQISCPSNVTVNNTAGQCGANVSFSIPTATDNCPGVSVVASPPSGSFFTKGATTVTLTAVDGAGNQGQCTFSVNVNDNEAPTANCPANITVNNGPGQCGAAVNFSIPTPSDNCVGVSAAASPASGAFFAKGTQNVTVTATDASGNTDQCSFSVTVNDTEVPNMVCNSFDINLTGGNASITAGQIDGGSTDNCGITNLQLNNASFDCSTIGAQTITLSGTDAAGNTGSCNATITVIDNNQPTAVCANPTVNLTSDGVTNVAASLFDGGSSAVCGGLSFSASMTGFNCDDVGNTYSVTLTVTSTSSGQSATCNSSVTVADPNSFCCAPASAVCNDFTVQLDQSGAGSISAVDIGSGSVAECGIQSELLSVSTFGCSDVGDNTVTYTITDINGDSDNCNSTVTVVDDVSPVAICQNISIELNSNGMVSISANEIDNNSSDACGISGLSVTPNTFGCNDIGSNTVQLTVSDQNGNTASCNAMVTVQDNIAPSAVCLSTTIELQADGSYDLQESDAFDAINSADNCGITSISFPPATYSCDQVGQSFSVPVTISDASGNSNTCTAQILVKKGTALPGNWTSTDIGSPTQSSTYSFDPCTSPNPNKGEFGVVTGGYNLIPNTSDEVGFIGRELCGTGGIQAKIEAVTNGYAGLMIRENNAPGAKMVAMYSNLSNLLRWESRQQTDGARNSSNFFKPFPVWLRLVRQGNYIRGFYRTSASGSWTLVHQVYLPMNDCIEMGLAVFTTDPNGSASAVFSNVNAQSNVGNNLAAPGGTIQPAVQHKRKAYINPNPTNGEIRLSLSTPTRSPGIVTVWNEFGQPVRKLPLSPGVEEMTWDLQDLPAGLYVLQMLTEDGFREVFKLIKQ